MLTRRRLIQSGLTTAAAVSFGPAFWRDAFAAPPATLAPYGPYGPLQPADANGLQLPPGFSSRVIAQSGQPVASTGYVFPIYPDGAATIRMPSDGGWILAINSEVPGGAGGASAIRFDARGGITNAYRILGGTSTNCAGGGTPWGTWLSCEEVPRGMVWECDVTTNAPTAHPALGVFQHEAACVDPVRQQVYLSEDVDGGGLYRFTPAAYPDLSAGVLEIACAGVGTGVVWKVLPDPTFLGATPTRSQHADSIKFRRGEGIWYDTGRVYLTTTTDETVHVYDTNAATVEVLYRAGDLPGTPLKGIDNILATRSGDLMVAEDSYDNDPDAMDVCLLTQANQVSRFLKITGDAHFKPVQSEVVSIAFNPDGTRMYVASQRHNSVGILYEISGPFRADQATVWTPPPTPTPPTPPAPPAPPTPGVPIGLDIAKRVSEKSFIRSGLAVGFSLEKAASVRIRVTAKIGNRTKTLASTTRSAKAGRNVLRVKASKSGAKLLKGRRRDVKATVEIRVTTPGAPVRTFKRTVTVRQ
ncbi:PhoX family protein [Solirubrobacter phytolaccae]|uniref:PhoX family protein n=1 Tax=Solirubrobacter phytolaccae TaxID=1404360 RepID=A0A9X3NCV9_9ACTN|nr:alkaline phosphatase PhoX [Solirubrobacter phytolaccae]MDA0182844.1 PhoX family protein [Solirubrobacter phytolaccae]